MTIRQLHIGIDLAFQQLNSNLFNRLEDEDKDYILNDGVVSYLTELSSSKDEGVLPFSTIKNRYNRVHSLIATYNMPCTNEGNYIVCNLPFNNEVNEDNEIVTGDQIVDGVSYKVVSDSTYDLSSFGGTTSATKGTVFKCDLGYAEIEDGEAVFTIGEYIAENPTIDVYENITTPYRGKLTIEADITIPVSAQSKYKRLATTLNVDDLSLYPVTSIGFFDILRLEANIETDQVYTEIAELQANQYYKVTTESYLDLSAYGGYTETYNTTIFKATQAGSIILPLNTVITKCDQVPVRIVKSEDVEGELSNSYGVTKDSLIAEFIGDTIRIHGAANTVINYADLVYLKQPANVSYENNVTLDLPIKTHPEVLAYTIAKQTRDYMTKNAAATGQIPQGGATA